MFSSGSPAFSLYSQQGARKYLTPQERARFIVAARQQPRAEVAALCLTLAYTGCRISEALALVAAQFEAQGGFIAIRSLKKRHRAIAFREIPVPAEVMSAVAKLLPADPSQRIWTLSRGRAWQLVKAVMDDAEICDGLHKTPKGLRHGFGLHAVRSGVPLNLVQRWLGHARLETTAIYLQAMGVEERELASRMWS